MKTPLRICGLWLLTLLMLAGPGMETALHAQTISLFAGSGSSVYNSYTSFTATTAATSAYIGAPNGVATDAAGNRYIVDGANNVVYKVNSSGIISLFAGSGSSVYNSYTSFTATTAATSAYIGAPNGVATDATGNVYISDGANNVVYKVNSSGIISLFAGSGSTSTIVILPLPPPRQLRLHTLVLQMVWQQTQPAMCTFRTAPTMLSIR